MSGHSKWASIKHQKGIADARRGQLFTKLTREIIVAVRDGGSSPDTNFRLRLCIQKARDNSMPMENVERAIKRGSGKLEGMTLIEMTLEGYGPGGVAILVEAVTDNRNRTLQDVRNLFTRNGGSLGESGCVSWLFDLKGLIRVNTDNVDADEVTLKAIDAGAEDVIPENTSLQIYTKPDGLEMVRKTLEESNIPVESAEQMMVPKTTVELDEKAALQALRLVDKLEDLDEVQRVSINADFDEAVLEKYNA
ncbi:MAG: YebC/PmpR family DNA-binding transcriptional regulator [Dehalococcoidales bacterium]|nr:YebC/PmpR family DNA-binding transcriptional regulator [Dehalococcoidales bacterium]